MKLIRNLLTFSAVILCFLLAACTSTLASSALPTAVNTAVPIVVPPTPPTAVPIAIPSTPTVETVATAVMPPVAEGSFTQQVVNAFNTGDYVWVNAHMGSEFTIAGWRAGGSALPPAAAVDQLRTVYFGTGSQPSFQLGADTTALLGGTDPLSLWGEGTAVTDALYITGLGSNAQDEALLILAQYDDSTPYLFGLLSALGGFAAYN